MKKKEVKKNKKTTISEERKDLKSLNSELGSFGLEPPKIYRKDQRINDYSYAFPKKQVKRKKVSPKTVQEKRAEQNRKRKKNKIKRKIVLYFLSLIGILSVIIVLSLTVLFKIETITIKGNEIYTAKEITAVFPIEKGKNLFLADTSFAKEKIEENLPYVYNAEIKRKLPSTILINITETPKIYYIKNRDKTYTLLDDHFKVLESSVAQKPKSGVKIEKAALTSAVIGKKAEFTSSQTMENLEILTDAIKKYELNEVTGIYSVDINNNYIVYENRITLKLGSLDDLEKKIYSALSAIEKLNESNPQMEGEMTLSGDKQVYFTEK